MSRTVKITKTASQSVSGATQPDDEAVAAERMWTRSVEFLRQLRIHYPLYFLFLFLFLALSVTMYIVVKPTYTAIATIGPPGQSPVTSLLSGIDGGAGQSVRRLLGGSSSGAGADPFQEYLQVLHSSRLASELAEKDNFLPKLFSRSWDAEHKQWKQSGNANGFIAVLKRALHRPIAGHPDADTLAEMLPHTFLVSQAPSSAASILSMGSSYMVATFRYSAPREAEDMLNAVLSRADTIIRQEQQRDVLARISYIETELPNVTQAEQRDSLIQILSSQEELQIMMVADKRFAFTMIDPPHASPIPTSPMGPTSAFLMSVLAALGFTALFVFLGMKSNRIRMLISPFNREARQKTPGRSAVQEQRLSNAL
jgi:hypothetical protein